MNLEQSLNSSNQEKIINNESVEEVAPAEVVSEEDNQAKIELKAAKIELKAQKEKENNEQIAKIKEGIMNQLGGQESKEEYPEGHIMNPQMLDKIAQLEAISPSTLEFDQQRYDDYINSSEGNTIKKGQDEIKARLNEGKKPRYSNISIYGKGGWNRYDATDGIVRLSRGSSVTTGGPEYKTKLAQKARELGIKVEGE